MPEATSFNSVLTSKLKGIFFTVTGSLLLAVCAIITININHALSLQTQSAVGLCYQSDYPSPFVRNGGYHNHFRFVDNQMTTRQIYQSTIFLYRVNDKVPIRYNPHDPGNQVSAGSVFDIYMASILTGLIGVVHLSVGLLGLFKKT